jgi:DNA polymerase-1
MGIPLELEDRINKKDLRPWQRLPLPKPADLDLGPEFFHDNFVHPLIEDAIRLMCAGLYIDNDAVEALRSTIDEVLSNVDALLLRNSVIQKYQEQRAVVAQKVHIAKSTEAVRDIGHYLRDYDESSMLHRTWVVNTYLKSVDCAKDIKETWPVKDLKAYNSFKENDFIAKVLDKSIAKKSETVAIGMIALAEHKVELWNRPRYDKAKSKASLDPFNPGSAKQKQELFAMLNIEPLAVSETSGDGSWGREYIEILLKQSDHTDEAYDEVLQCIIDHSFSGIIRNNFLKAFDTYTIDGVLHGNIKIFGAKSFRPTSNSPNLLNMPSTKSIYAKPLKKCFIAPEGMLIYAIDLGALEDRVIANLSGDVNKSNIFLEGLDGHSLNACGYFPEKIAEVMGPNTDNVAYVKEFYRLADVEKHPVIGKIRSASKAPTFKLAYGGFPDADKGGVITQEIFDNYHNNLYPGITKYREEYVLPTTIADGYLHLGLGCRIYSDDPEGDIRTLNNATCQFWSILTQITINELNYRVEEAGYRGRIEVCSTIYDSLYIYVEDNAETIKWLNDNAVELLCVDYITDQVVKNEAEGELGRNWADLHKIVNDASVEEIEDVIKQIKEE